MPAKDRLEAIHKALAEITVPLIGSTLTPIVVFLPLISITGVTGTIFPRAGGHHVRCASYLTFSGPDLDADAQPVLHAQKKEETPAGGSHCRQSPLDARERRR